MSLWWFARCCHVRKTVLPGLLPTVWLAATAVIGVNASALRGLSTSSGLAYQTVRLYLSAVRHLQIAGSIARGTPFTELCAKRPPMLTAQDISVDSRAHRP